MVFLCQKSNQDTQGRTGNRLPLSYITTPPVVYPAQSTQPTGC
uniref:Uncharacterized protein n=3 Tax=unclassified Caudoviricetes TaxID=2788787 RepID=A0A8S5NES3_9CAUD|nr:MAG TPA: hypothetical protein [Siphoviridae sp. ctGFb30]DAD93325.1 MAG TPA: hypothetical protein [Siphoviridae sp. ct0UA44]DAD99604.1 MAG TPA: hypothetical protein [Siphoviridae sp. ctind17]